MNFLKVIGQHMESSGLAELWVESGLLGSNAASQVMSGKSYARGVRTHKLTFQAAWQLILPRFADSFNQDIQTSIASITSFDEKENIEDLVKIDS